MERIKTEREVDGKISRIIRQRGKEVHPEASLLSKEEVKFSIQRNVGKVWSDSLKKKRISKGNDMEIGGIGRNMTLNKRLLWESTGLRSVVMRAGLEIPLNGICSVLAPQPISGAEKYKTEFIPSWKKEEE